MTTGLARRAFIKAASAVSCIVLDGFNPRTRSWLASAHAAQPPWDKLAGLSTPADWQAHYGAQTWKRLVAAKKTYDPANILTPGTGMFPAPL